jgi:HSP20 family protein
MTMSLRRSGGGGGQADRWHPLREFDNLYGEVDRLMQSVMGGRDSGPWVPAADITETDDAYVIELELPGIRREDVNVELQGNEVVVTGEVKQREREGLLRRRTRRVGEFEFRVALPDFDREGEIEASLAHGVLTIYVPKERSKSNRIEVTESDGASAQ